MTIIAITGATGQLGRLAIAALKARGVQPIALARDPAGRFPTVSAFRKALLASV